jgi:hypothetical protein
MNTKSDIEGACEPCECQEDSFTDFCCFCLGPAYSYAIDLRNLGGDIGANKPFGGIPAPIDGWDGTIIYENEEGQTLEIIKAPGMPLEEVAANFSPVSASYNSGFKRCRYVEQLQNGVTIESKTYIINGDDDNSYSGSSEWIIDFDSQKYSSCAASCENILSFNSDCCSTNSFTYCCEQCREIDITSLSSFVSTAQDPCGFLTSSSSKVCCETFQPYDENNLGSCLCEE